MTKLRREMVTQEQKKQTSEQSEGLISGAHERQPLY